MANALERLHSRVGFPIKTAINLEPKVFLPNTSFQMDLAKSNKQSPL